MKKTTLSLLLLFVAFITAAQTITGNITDSQNDPIPNAVLILQNSDSSFVSATTTDSVGDFTLQINIGNGLVVVQHLTYETKTIAFAQGDYSTLKKIALTEKTNQLDGITVSTDAPDVIVKDNALVYNAQHIAEKKAVSNAFELLKYTPGVTTRNDDISLAGASQLTVIIDGKATMLSNSEIAELLKAMPASSIGNIEVMYKAPAKYGVKGALINIATSKNQRKTPWEAELATEYLQEFYATERSRANIAYRSEKLDVDVLANASYGKIRYDGHDYSINNFNGVQTIIDQESFSANKKNNNMFRTSIDFNFNEDNSISLMYYGKFSKKNEPIKSETKFLYHTGETGLVSSINTEDGKNYLHNVNLKGVFGGANITADYISYYDKTGSEYNDFENGSITADYQNKSKMDIDQYKLIASYDWEFSDIWQMSAGAQGTMTNSATEVSYLYPKNGVYELDKSSYSDNQQKEHRLSVFAETFNTIFDSIQLDFTLELEYFKSDYDENGTKSTLWDEWHLYPSLSIMWPLKHDVIQMSVSTYKNYPSYWDLSPHSLQMNPYKFCIGNPLLKPSTSYDISLAYMLNKTYTIEAYCFYEKDAFRELPYQDAEKLRNYHQTVNFDYELTSGIGGEIPFEVSFWEPTLSGYMIYTRCKMSDFHGLSFERNNFFVSVAAENTFTVSEEKPNLKFMLTAEYMSKSIQGIYDMNDGYNLEIGMRWAILDNLIFTANWTDIFERWGPYPATVNFNGQYNKVGQKLYNKFNASLVWRIGGFKAKDVEITDTERMQR